MPTKTKAEIERELASAKTKIKQALFGGLALGFLVGAFIGANF